MNVWKSGGRLRLALLLLAASSTVFWWVVVPLAGTTGDLGDWGERQGLFRALGTLAKMASGFACLALVGQAYRAIGGDGARARRAMFAWAGAGFAIVLVMAAFRGPIADFWGTPSTHLSTSHLIAYPSIATGEVPVRDLARHEAWLHGWRSGRLLAIEAAFCLVLAAAHAGIGLSRVGRSRSDWGVAFAFLVTVELAWIFTLAFGLVWSTFDIFHHSIAVSSIAFDLTVPVVAMLPESPVAAPFVFVYALVAYGLVTAWETRSAPLRLRPLTARPT